MTILNDIQTLSTSGLVSTTQKSKLIPPDELILAYTSDIVTSMGPFGPNIEWPKKYLSNIRSEVLKKCGD